jgi:hypothetical protein
MFRAQWMSSLPDFGSFSWSLMNCMALALSFTFVDFAWRGILPRTQAILVAGAGAGTAVAVAAAVVVDAVVVVVVAVAAVCGVGVVLVGGVVAHSQPTRFLVKKGRVDGYVPRVLSRQWRAVQLLRKEASPRITRGSLWFT